MNQTNFNQGDKVRLSWLGQKITKNRHGNGPFTVLTVVTVPEEEVRAVGHTQRIVISRDGENPIRDARGTPQEFSAKLFAKAKVATAVS